MSEDKRQHLANTLSSLSNEDKAWVINFLVQGLCGFRTPSEANEGTTSRRVVKVRRTNNDSLSDEELDKLFAGKEIPEMPREEFSLQDCVKATSGKYIKQIEKWL